MTDPLASARVGERWVVRVRLADGSATDLVGWVDSVDVEAVVVTSPDRPPQIVRRSTVLVARRAPAARGAPHPRRVSVTELERRMLPGWLAYSEPLGEWTLRAGGGFTGRANSCHAVGDPGLPVAEAGKRIVAYAARHGIAPMGAVVTGSAEEQGLRSLGWVDTYVPTRVLVTRLTDLLDNRPVPEAVRVTETLESTWEQAYARSRPQPADRTVVRRILEGRPPRAFAAVEADVGVVAIGRGHVSGSWLGVAAVWVDGDHRRDGRGTAIMIALAHWAARRSARYAYVQVDRENQTALTAFERLGFQLHHSCLYLAPP
jgi:GNAT superfamily N-acetyltransferase